VNQIVQNVHAARTNDAANAAIRHEATPVAATAVVINPSPVPAAKGKN